MNFEMRLGYFRYFRSLVLFSWLHLLLYSYSKKFSESIVHITNQWNILHATTQRYNGSLYWAYAKRVVLPNTELDTAPESNRDAMTRQQSVQGIVNYRKREGELA